MDNILLCLNINENSFEKLNKKDVKKLKQFLEVDSNRYTEVIVASYTNFLGYVTRGESTIPKFYFNYTSSLSVHNNDIDCSKLRRNVEYHICGIGLSGAILHMALEMRANGLNPKLIKEHCYEVDGLDKEAIKILQRFIPNCFI